MKVKIYDANQGTEVIKVKSLDQARMEWELSKAPTSKLVAELLNRGDITFDEYTWLTHHMETLMAMDVPGISDDEIEDIKEMMENI